MKGASAAIKKRMGGGGVCVLVARLQLQPPLGQDSMISLTEMEPCQCQKGFRYILKCLRWDDNLESWAEGKQTEEPEQLHSNFKVDWMCELTQTANN